MRRPASEHNTSTSQQHLKRKKTGGECIVLELQKKKRDLTTIYVYVFVHYYVLCVFGNSFLYSLSGILGLYIHYTHASFYANEFGSRSSLNHPTKTTKQHRKKKRKSISISATHIARIV